MYIPRQLEASIKQTLKNGKSILLWGPRQTGKTTLIQRLPHELYISFASPKVRLQHEQDVGLLTKNIEALSADREKLPLVILDEIQKVPLMMDAVQDLVDRKKAQFILTGSSARKLRHGPHVNLLPGRILTFHLDPLLLREQLPKEIEDYLLYGSLPEVTQTKSPEDRDTFLSQYLTNYLEEEVRAEALVRDLGLFGRFLELAASESNQLLNFSKLSQDIGVSHPTIAAYYQILEDCLIAERVEPLSQSKTRKKLTRSQKYLFFDMGVRRLAAREGTAPSRDVLGNWFEHFVGLELIRCARLKGRNTRIHFWRDPDGPEVDWVISEDKEIYIPIEVKWTERPTPGDSRHLQTFLDEYPGATQGYIVCRTPVPFKISDRITALPWQQLDSLIFKK